MKARLEQVVGLMGEFATQEALEKAATAAYAAGYRKLDAFSPFPIEGLADRLGFRHCWIPLLVLLGGLGGGFGGYALQFFGMVINYPFDVGGRPLHSWPLFIPVTFEMTVLGAALTGLVSMLLLNGLPRLHHPVFSVPGFEQASVSRFFLYIEARDLHFDPVLVRDFFQRTEAQIITEVVAR